MSRIDGVPLLRAKWCLRVTIRSDRRTLLLLLSLLPFAACGGVADSSRAAATSVDSAGVQIVTSTDPAWPHGGGWQISAAPALEIGMAEGPNEYLLSQVQSALRRDDGAVLVANGQTAEIRLYNAEGRYLASMGRRGSGPGEFQNLTWMGFVTGDSVAVYDAMARRLSLFSPEGDFVRAASVGAVEGGSFPLPVGMLNDRSLVAVTLEFTGEPPRAGVVTRTPERVLRFGPAGALLDTVALLPGNEVLVQQITSSSGANLVMMSQPLFARPSVKAVVSDHVVIGSGSGDGYELRVLTPEGRVERLIRRAVQPRAVTEEMLEAARLERVANIPSEEERARRDRSLREAPHGSTVPFFNRIVGDDDANLWVQDFAVPGEASPDWTVFDPDGRLLGAVQMPPGLRPLHIGSDFVLGVARDELDVERVQLYTLEKGDGR